MSVARVTEISSQSPTSFVDAIRQGIRRANQTLRNVEGAWVKEQQVDVNDGKIVAYRVNMLVTFVLDDARPGRAAATRAAAAPAKPAARKRAPARKRTAARSRARARR